MVRFALFLAGCSGILCLSRRSLKNFHSHGFYRFFAFELLLALILLNSPVWFREPFSPRQRVSWFFGIASIALVIEGFRLLRVIGRPSYASSEDANFSFESIIVLVTIGAYRFIRHPLYASLVALDGCAYLKNPSSATCIMLALGGMMYLLATAVAEETENLAKFAKSF